MTNRGIGTSPAQVEWLAALGQAIQPWVPILTAAVGLWQAWNATQEAQERAAQAQQAYYAQERLMREQLAATKRIQAYVCYGIFGAGLAAFILSMRRG